MPSAAHCHDAGWDSYLDACSLRNCEHVRPTEPVNAHTKSYEYMYVYNMYTCLTRGARWKPCARADTGTHFPFVRSSFSDHTMANS